MNHNYTKLFPYKEIRKEQKEAIARAAVEEVQSDDDAKGITAEEFKEMPVKTSSTSYLTRFSPASGSSPCTDRMEAKIEGLDYNVNETDENLSFPPSVPTHNQFHLLSQPGP